MERQIDGVFRTAIDARELLHRGLATVRAELGLPSHPLGALLGDGPLGEFVFEADLEFGSEKVSFAFGLGNVEFTTLFMDLVGDLRRDEGGGGENEFEGKFR